jgi:putative transcriptional regulator
MTKKAFDKIAAGLQAAADYANGTADVSGYRVHVPSDVDVKAIRKRLGMTQERFASTFGFPITTLRDWEQGRARPDTSARAYLIVIAREPEAVERALQAA